MLRVQEPADGQQRVLRERQQIRRLGWERLYGQGEETLETTWKILGKNMETLLKNGKNGRNAGKIDDELWMFKKK